MRRALSEEYFLKGGQVEKNTFWMVSTVDWALWENKQEGNFNMTRDADVEVFIYAAYSWGLQLCSGGWMLISWIQRDFCSDIGNQCVRVLRSHVFGTEVLGSESEMGLWDGDHASYCQYLEFWSGGLELRRRVLKDRCWERDLMVVVHRHSGRATPNFKHEHISAEEVQLKRKGLQRNPGKVRGGDGAVESK